MAVFLGAKNTSGRVITFRCEPNRLGNLDEVLAAIRPVAHSVTVEFSQPFSIVQHAIVSAIAIIPSKREEPFGRTALEAHAQVVRLSARPAAPCPKSPANNAPTLPADFDAADVADRLKTFRRKCGLPGTLPRSQRMYSIQFQSK